MIDKRKYDQEVTYTNHSPWSFLGIIIMILITILLILKLIPPTRWIGEGSHIFLLNDERHILLGAVTILYYLSDYLLQYSGHIRNQITPVKEEKNKTQRRSNLH